jgi:uncharacterized YigZ family protein
MSEKPYKTIEGTARGEYEDRKSRFICDIAHVETEEEALAFLEGIKREHPMARHHVYAYILRAGNRVRYTDDGEPAKTAGMPTLAVLEHAELKDVIAVTTRYFGGTLLGTGGLVRAYTKAPQVALEQAQVVMLAPCRDIIAEVSYSLYDPVKHKLDDQSIAIVDTQFADAVTLTLRTRTEDTDAVVELLANLTQGSATVLVSDEALQLVAW